MNRTCRIDGCTKTTPRHALVCDMHRSRLYRTGDPNQAATPLDQIAIDATVANRRTPGRLRPAERRRAGQKLAALGLPTPEIARIFDVSERTVWRWRATA
jgi:DNA-directed RNA polymerase specialized sigma24 family protein